MRATDIRYLNDSQELQDGLQRLAESLERPSYGLFVSDEYRNESIEHLRTAFADSVSFGISEEPLFVLSFSRAEDLLSQWRAYGSYAIEFNEKLLLDSIPSLNTCIYDLKTKNDLSQSLVTKSLMDISQDMRLNNGCVGEMSLKATGKLSKLAATFKQEGFSEEQEVRVVSHASESGYSIHYYPKDDMLIPYVDIEISLDCIQAIHVGPMRGQKLAYTSMRDFIKEIEKSWQSDSGNIEYELEIKKSETSFRSKLR